MSSIEVNVRAVLDDLAMRRRLVVTAIRDIALFYRLDPQPWLDDAAATEQPVVAHEQPAAARATRPTTAPTDTQERILAALKAAKKPVSPAELAKAMNMTRPNVRYHVKAMVETGLVREEGTTLNRRLSIAS